MAVTDLFHLGSAVRLRRLCTAAGIKAIIGMDVRFSFAEPTDLFPARSSTLTLLATGSGGWKSLVAIHNLAHADLEVQPLVTPGILARHSTGLTILTGGAGGPLALAIDRGDLPGARSILGALTAAVGCRALVIAASGLETEERWSLMTALSDQSGVPLAAVQLVEYLDEDQSAEREAFCAARAGVRLDDPQRPRPAADPAFLASSEQMLLRRPEDKHWQRALRVTADIAEHSVDTLPSRDVRVPDASQDSADAQLRALAYSRAAALMAVTREVRERLDHELSTIADAGTAAAFLVVAGTHEWMNSESILTNSRSSANCSMVLHCLGVAETNPLEKDLPFDRFLAETPDVMPSVHVDVQPGARAGVEAFLVSEYGTEQVARVAAFPRIRTRRAVKDAARTLGEKQAGRKLLEEADPGATVSDLLAEPDLSPDQKEVLQLASAIEGAPAAQGVSAGTVVIAGEPIQDLVPVRPAADGGLPVICLSAEDVQSLGFLKIDFQGQPVLERTANTLQLAQAHSSHEVPQAQVIADSAGDVADPRVCAAWDLLAGGDTSGVFLMSNPENVRYARQAAPKTLDDLAALTALNRPGFTDAAILQEYLADKKGISACARYTQDTGEQALLHGLLGRTRGLIIFQEQIIMLCQKLAGAAGEEADRWRLALQQDGPAELAGVRAEFLARARGTLRPRTALKVYESMVRAGPSAFSASHAHAQARLTFVDAWLAANHPEHFRAAHAAGT